MNDKFTRLGFILSVAGGAVGLGNAWKFPTLVGQNGGFAFVLLYLVLTLSIGFSIFLAEMAMGRLSGKDPVNSYKNLAPSHLKNWKYAGFTMLGGIFVLSFYLVIMGWVIRYIFISFSALPQDIETSGKLFGNFITNDLNGNLFFYFLAFFSTLAVVSKGIKSGIEKLNVYVMPTLFILLLAMLIYSFSMEGFSKAFVFLFKPDFSKITFDVVLTALGLAFFTLCVGIGCITTYAASLEDDTNLVKSSISIVFINILIGLMMGLIVFTFVFEFNADPSTQGAGLVFVSLMTLFAKIGIIGNVLAVTFFVSLYFAGITSAVSMIEPFVFYLINEYKISRLKALSFCGVLIIFLSTLCILSMHSSFGAKFTFFDKSFFDILDFVSSNLMLPLGAFLTAIFVGYIMDKNKIYNLYKKDMSGFWFKIWYNFLRYIAPVCVVVIVVKQIFFS
ncbi:sodium- and chloride-dependent transporter [Campylobacter sputorum subsp. bubulus]|uniref:Sodium- and chloride-dependent transporter n=1 Tax=Campylobacter sputorum subsp. sputorum TaxID=32024 RepID=A0A381DJ20_9BACT|nr:sodium-dependent transporter [Campylobacter sputorum]ASM35696.1 Na+-dependent transporter, SNF family [Campylobacter sputorum aubsp. sputorum RM3237]ASM37414.1 Na+-dependent transporter, SNF family [Campylobacter sputorum bv. faecalis CCUG 20703]KAB0582574.1 sodium-dependent transporter [Campylobacter sputorum subsp. sputorum]QEL05888.1 sodium-dependent transporter, SNF family [Campylobacter sputorum subsp. sputorum]SUX07857.1 sodium- and chloride-dependent transporter [Campylobacter sputor